MLECPGPVKERLRSLLEWAIERDFEDTSKGCLLINATMERGRSDSTVESVSSRHVERLESVLCHVMEEAGEINSDRTALDLALRGELIKNQCNPIE